MHEISLFTDEELTKPVEGLLTFEPVPAGKTSGKRIYITNNIKFPVKLEIEITGEDMSIKHDIDEILPNSTQGLDIIFAPKLTHMKPMTGKINIKLEYVVT